MRLRLILFTISFTAAVAFCIYCIAKFSSAFIWAPPDSGPGLVITLFFIPPAIFLAVAEWFLFVRNKRQIEEFLGIAWGAIGGYALLILGMQLLEPWEQTRALSFPFWLVFGAIGTYGLFCCWYRALRRSSEGVTTIRREHPTNAPKQPPLDR